MKFSQEVYHILELHQSILPAGFAAMLPYMKQQNWLFNYVNKTGIRRSMEGLVHRAKYMSDSTMAFDIFLNNQSILGEAYRSFFPQLVLFTKAAVAERSV
jgi:acyl carrier protein phosphodiesterase